MLSIKKNSLVLQNTPLEPSSIFKFPAKHSQNAFDWQKTLSNSSRNSLKHAPSLTLPQCKDGDYMCAPLFLSDSC